MKAIPHNGYLLCKPVSNSQHEVVESGIAYQKEELPVYEVISVGDIPDDFRFTAGDKIIVNPVREGAFRDFFCHSKGRKRLRTHHNREEQKNQAQYMLR